MTDNKTPKSPTRREFFKTAGLGAAAGAVAGLGAEPVPAQAADAVPESQGYRETEHVKRYYELSKF
jgi:nitrous oxide reductase